MERASDDDDGGDESLPLAKWMNEFSRAFQNHLDRSTPHTAGRWLGTLGVVAIYVLRVYLLNKFYIVSYGLGIYLLYLLIGFLSPLVDPEAGASDGPSLPMKGSDEFKPFIRRLPEFKFWYAVTRALCIGFLMTFSPVFDVPVFWPVLLFYWIVLFVFTMKSRIAHMIKYKYVPFNLGKQRYGGKKSSESSSSSRD
ncbi:protein RER1A-like [Typha latifolia]|uniref:protein RER1A-like n=1 Tax=Typha latifolia TaxID=4733 RepID=UPI003C2B0E1A